MTIREQTEAIERQTLSRYATLRENSRGRRVPLEPDPIRPCFRRAALCAAPTRSRF